MDRVTRTGFLRGAVAGGAAVATGGAAAAGPGPPAAGPSANAPTWGGVAMTTAAVSAADPARARKLGGGSGDERRTLERATAAQVAHRNAFRTTLVDLKEPVIDPADIEIELPASGFTSRSAAITLGRRIESLLVHGYLGALTTINDSAIRRLFAQVTASDTAQLTWLAGLQGRVVTEPFPSVHGIGTAADALAEYLP